MSQENKKLIIGVEEEVVYMVCRCPNCDGYSTTLYNPEAEDVPTIKDEQFELKAEKVVPLFNLSETKVFVNWICYRCKNPVKTPLKVIGL